MKLYYLPAACSLSPHIIIHELGLDVDLIKVDHLKHTFGNDEDFYHVNSLGYVPALEIEPGNILLEGPAIVQYLADLKPEFNLAPKNGTLERYQLQQWLNFLSTEIHKGFIPLLYAGKAGKYVETAKPQLMDCFKFMNSELEMRDYVFGNSFTVADAYLFALIGWGQASWIKSYYKADIHFDELSQLKGWYERVKARASVQKALLSEGLSLD